MNSASYASLFERLQAHCRQRQWYGPDIYYNDKAFNRRPGGPWILHDFRADFFPPATEEQLRLSEEMMGVSYPPALRTLYLHLANGGFGPAYGLVGAFCGYHDAMNKNKDHQYLLHESVVQPSVPKDRTFQDLESYEQEFGNPKMIDIGPDVWPTVWSKSLIYLCEWGCGRSSYLHAHNGRVYFQDEERLFRQADSLEEWLERWLQGEDLEQVSWIW